MVWNRAPKDTFIKLLQFENSVYDAVSHFNIGNQATINVLQGMGLECGTYTLNGCCDNNTSRLRVAQHKNKSPVKKRRKLIRGKKKSAGDKL